MGNVGLLFVGAVLFLNGVMLRGWVEAAPINFFAGVVQVVTLSYLIFTANGALRYSGLNLIRFQDNGARGTPARPLGRAHQLIC